MLKYFGSSGKEGVRLLCAARADPASTNIAGQSALQAARINPNATYLEAQNSFSGCTLAMLFNSAVNALATGLIKR